MFFPAKNRSSRSYPAKRNWRDAVVLASRSDTGEGEAFTGGGMFFPAKNRSSRSPRTGPCSGTLVEGRLLTFFSMSSRSALIRDLALSCIALPKDPDAGSSPA